MSAVMIPATLAPEADRLSRLRARTDRQILDFIQTKLDAALRLAGRAGADSADGAPLAAQQSLSAADRALGEAQKLLLVLEEAQRRELDGKVAGAMEAIARVCRDRDLLRPLFLIAGARPRA
jgi:hypothetical protein